MAEPSAFVLDTFALLAYLQGEKSGVRVREILRSTQGGAANIYMSIINVGEVLYIIERRMGMEKAHDALATIRQLPIEVLPADDPTVFLAAHIKANYAVSYADAFAIAAAQNTGGVILTGDPEFEEVKDIVTLEWLPKPE